MLRWVRQAHPEHLDTLNIGYFHLGADITASLPTSGISANDFDVLGIVGKRPSFLMVGTLEPRKSHAQALYAVELLWASGVDVNLVIVGKQALAIDTAGRNHNAG